MSRAFLILSAAIELPTGVALLAMPAWPVSLLLGTAPDTAGGVAAARVAGAAVLALGWACWMARYDGRSRAGRAVIAAMSVYDIAVVAVLLHARLGLDTNGPLLWPAVALHGTLALWGVACIRTASGSSTETAR